MFSLCFLKKKEDSFPGEVIKGDSIFHINVTLSSALSARIVCGPGRETMAFYFYRATSRWPSSASGRHQAVRQTAATVTEAHRELEQRLLVSAA